MTTISYSNDCCNLEQANELKKLGVKQESAYYYNTDEELIHTDAALKEYSFEGVLEYSRFIPYDSCLSAFNTGELIAMSGFISDLDWLKIHKAKSVAEGIAEMLLKEKEKDVILIDDMNRRLDEFHGVKEE